MGKQQLKQNKTATPTRPQPTKTSVKSPVHPLEELQAAIGNREMGRLMESNPLPHPSSPFPKLPGELPLLGGMPVSQGTIQRQPLFRGLSQELNAEMGTLVLPETGAVVQRKLTLGTPGDMYEQEADRVARQVVDEIHSSPIREQNALSEEERIPAGGEAGRVQRQITVRTEGDAGGELSSEWEGQLQRAKSGGQPLSPSVREPMERAFGADFGGVRVHTGAQADMLARSIQAYAFTTGQDVFFRQGAYQPGSRGGQELIAHELTHVVQQEETEIEKKQKSGSHRTEIGKAVVQRAIGAEIEMKEIKFTASDQSERFSSGTVIGAVNLNNIKGEVQTEGKPADYTVEVATGKYDRGPKEVSGLVKGVGELEDAIKNSLPDFPKNLVTQVKKGEFKISKPPLQMEQNNSPKITGHIQITISPNTIYSARELYRTNIPPIKTNSDIILAVRNYVEMLYQFSRLDIVYGDQGWNYSSDIGWLYPAIDAIVRVPYNEQLTTGKVQKNIFDLLPKYEVQPGLEELTNKFSITREKLEKIVTHHIDTISNSWIPEYGEDQLAQAILNKKSRKGNSNQLKFIKLTDSNRPSKEEIEKEKAERREIRKSCMKQAATKLFTGKAEILKAKGEGAISFEKLLLTSNEMTRKINLQEAVAGAYEFRNPFSKSLTLGEWRTNVEKFELDLIKRGVEY